MRIAANSRYGLGTRHSSFLRLTRLKGKLATQMEIQMFGLCFMFPPPSTLLAVSLRGHGKMGTSSGFLPAPRSLLSPCHVTWNPDPGRHAEGVH